MLPSLARVHVLKATEVLGTCGACKPAGTPGTRHRFQDCARRPRPLFRRRLRSSSVEFILATAAASALRRTRLSRSVMIASVGLVTRRRFRRAAVLSCVMCAGLRP